MAVFNYVSTLIYQRFLLFGTPGYIFGIGIVIGNFVLPWWKSRGLRNPIAIGINAGTASLLALIMTFALHHDRSPVRQPNLTQFIDRTYEKPWVVQLHLGSLLITQLPGSEGLLLRTAGLLRRLNRTVTALRDLLLNFMANRALEFLTRYSPIRRKAEAVSAERYHYTPITRSQRDTIRLLLIHPTLGRSTIHCTLFQTPLHSAPRYDAISYCWGNPRSTHNISVNGNRLSPATNAFQVLRNRSSFLLPRLIWIDSLCINQDDDEEKANQVQLMGNIYSQAYIVSVMLAQDPDIRDKGQASQQAKTTWIRRWADALLALNMLDKLSVTGAEPTSNHERVMARLTPRTQFGMMEWHALQDLLNNPWFGRIWVVQEVVLARRVRAQYNHFEVDWDMLIHGTLAFGRFPALWLLLVSTEAANRVKRKPGGVGTVLSIHDYHERISSSKAIPISDLLFDSTKFKSTDPRDMVFAVQGMCSKLPSELMKPRYGQTTVNEVYTNAAICLIRAGTGNRMLAIAGVGYRNPATLNTPFTDFPTWVPDWSGSVRSASLSFFRPEIDYFAGGKTTQEVQAPESSSPGRLRLQGWMFDSIDELAECVESLHPDDAQLEIRDIASLFIDAVPAFWETVQTSDRTKNPYPHTDPPQALREAFWRTLIGDRDETRPAPPSLASGFEKLVEFCDIVSKDPSILYGATHDIATMHEIRVSHLQTAKFVLPLMRCLGARRLCITKRGLLGVVPPFSKVGDVIAVFQGMQTPFILRNTAPGTGHQLVGECYMHGIMSGEVLERGLQTQTIEIV
jgi:hypothetical protein